MSELQTTLSHLVQSRSDSNPAFDSLLHDYAEYHAVLVAFGGVLTLGLVLLSLFSWRRFKRAPRTATRRSTFERSTFRAFAVSSAAVSLCLAVIVFANLGNALDPRHGLSTAIPAFGAPLPGTEQQQCSRPRTHGCGRAGAKCHRCFRTRSMSGCHGSAPRRSSPASC